jgi:hypothetical protein
MEGRLGSPHRLTLNKVKTLPSTVQLVVMVKAGIAVAFFPDNFSAQSYQYDSPF